MKGGDILEFLFFLIVIAITIVGRIIKAQAEKAKNSRNDPWGSASDDDGWETWEPESTTADSDWSTQAPATGNFSKYQQEMQEFDHKRKEAERLEQQIEVSPPLQMPTPTPMAQYEVETESAYDLPELQSYEPPVQPAFVSQSERDSVPVEVDEEALAQMRQAMANAFPKARRMNRKASGKSRAIQITIKGRSDLRRAVLLNEVLGQPRAFDL